MNVREALAKLQAARAALIDNREADVLRISFDLAALIKLRIQTTGQDSSNTPFSPYTPDYSKKRKKAGYQVSFVDFTVTGRMFANIAPRIVSSTETGAVVEIGATDDKTKLILAGQFKKRGNILLPTEEEKELVRRLNRERIKNRLKF